MWLLKIATCTLDKSIIIKIVTHALYSYMVVNIFTAILAIQQPVNYNQLLI